MTTSNDIKEILVLATEEVVEGLLLFEVEACGVVGEDFGTIMAGGAVFEEEEVDFGVEVVTNDAHDRKSQQTRQKQQNSNDQTSIVQQQDKRIAIRVAEKKYNYKYQCYDKQFSPLCAYVYEIAPKIHFSCHHTECLHAQCAYNTSDMTCNYDLYVGIRQDMPCIKCSSSHALDFARHSYLSVYAGTISRDLDHSMHMFTVI